MRKVPVGLFVVGAAGIMVIAGAAWWLDYKREHRGYAPIDANAVEKARSYRGAPVLWLGEAFDVDGDGDAERLSEFRIHESADRDRRLPDEVYVSYGRCKFPPYEGGCAPPLVIIVEFTCWPVNETRKTLIRGAVVTWNAQDLELSTDQVKITILSSRLDEREVARSLSGANPLASHITNASKLTELDPGDCWKS